MEKQSEIEGVRLYKAIFGNRNKKIFTNMDKMWTVLVEEMVLPQTLRRLIFLARQKESFVTSSGVNESVKIPYTNRRRRGEAF
jgi:hypothetical protein